MSDERNSPTTGWSNYHGGPMHEQTVIRALWDCAKEKDVEVSGMSWNGFNLIGDRKSVDELRRLMHEEERFKAYRRRIEDGVS